MAETAILLAVGKISAALGGEIVKLSRQLLEKDVSLLLELPNGMSRIKSELLVMKGFFSQIDMRDRNNQVLEAWIGEVRKLAYRIEDIMDEYVYINVAQNQGNRLCGHVMKVVKGTQTLVALRYIAGELKEIEINLANLWKIKSRWVQMASTGLGDSSAYLRNVQLDQANASQLLDEQEFVGMEENKNKLIDMLSSNGTANLRIITVRGMIGLGKTALANNVFKIKRQGFECHAWVPVSQSYHIDQILRDLIKDLHGEKRKPPDGIENMSTLRLKELLKNFLEYKRYLIILDDVCSPAAYDAICGYLADNLRKSRIIITTRSTEVANLADEDHRHELQPLKDWEAFDLLFKMVFGRQHFPTCRPSTAIMIIQDWLSTQLKRFPSFISNPYNSANLTETTGPSTPSREITILGQEIVKRCEGLPLAIVSIGRRLSSREKTDEAEWKRVLDHLSSELGSDEQLSNILHLNYNDLPSHLKNCFLYCSMFPWGLLLSRKWLIQLWIAEGFVQERGASTLEEVAEGYINDLIHLSMLQLERKNHFGRISKFRMHKVFRQLAIPLSNKDSFHVEYAENKTMEIVDDTRRLSVIKCSNDKVSKTHLPSLRTFLVFDTTMQSSLFFSSVPSKSKYLRVLDLTGLPINTVPDAIGNLFNLRYLGMRFSKVKSLPESIRNLCNLQTLDLFSSKIEKLPHGIARLTKLRHLYATKDVDGPNNVLECISPKAPKGLWNLKELQTLVAAQASEELLERLADFVQLRRFALYKVKGIHCKMLCSSLSRMRFLSRLCLFADGENEVLQLEDLIPPPSLHRLNLVGRLVEDTFSSPLFRENNIKHLTLQRCQLNRDPISSLYHLSDLRKLFLKNAYNGEQLLFRAGWFPNLHLLSIIDMCNIDRVVIKEGAMEKLETLELDGLKHLTDVPAGIQNLKLLQVLLCVDMHPAFRQNAQNYNIGHIPNVFIR